MEAEVGCEVDWAASTVEIARSRRAIQRSVKGMKRAPEVRSSNSIVNTKAMYEYRDFLKAPGVSEIMTRLVHCFCRGTKCPLIRKLQLCC